jgi:hypothetical protein
MALCRKVRQWILYKMVSHVIPRKRKVHTKTNFPQNSNSTSNITRIQRIMEARHGIPTSIGNLLHFRQFFSATSGEVEERQFVKVFGLLVRFLNDLFPLSVTTMASRMCIAIPYDCLASKPAEPASPSNQVD